MKNLMEHYYRLINSHLTYCFNVELSAPLTGAEQKILLWLLSETFAPQNLHPFSMSELALSPEEFQTKKIWEIGPRLNFATARNTNAVAICHACGLTKVLRLERSRCLTLAPSANISDYFDRMTECIYGAPLNSFDIGLEPEALSFVPLKEKGPDALLEIPGLSMDEGDRQFYYDYFVLRHGRNPTIAEIMDLNNANSEHSRHGYFKGQQIIDGQLMPETLMEIVKSTWKANPGNSVIAFHDNSSAIYGFRINALMPSDPGVMSTFTVNQILSHLLFTAETHNFPTGVAPFQGAETGAGGRLRDGEDTGRGSLVIAGTAGYCVGNLLIPGYKLPWEKELVYPDNLASPLSILIKASNGASDYGNKFGEPLIQGFARASASSLPDGERREWIKPIMFTGGIGQIYDIHTEKQAAEPGMLIIQIGGPAYRIGLGGGAASSMIQGDNQAELDFNAVQRGDAEMEQKMNRVIRACVEMGENNPIISIHDQGAGGPANVLKELVEKAGGRIDIRRITVGDPTLSVMEIWVAEYQERSGLLLNPVSLPEFQDICKREHVNCEVLGKVTGDGRFVVTDSQDDSTPIDLELSEVLGNLPQKTFSSEHLPEDLEPLKLPEGLKVLDALKRVLRLVSVGSKRFLTNKVDRSVTGRIAQQQCCGPLQLPVSDVAVVAQSYLPDKDGLYSGGATAIGEQPLKMLVNPAAGARMAVAEALTNIVWAKITKLADIKCSGNWMWAAKLPGEGAKLYDAAVAMRDLMIKLGIAIDGGKDSLSMAAKVNHPDASVEIVKAPGELVISAYAPVPDVTKVITPDIKETSNRYSSEQSSSLFFLDLSPKKKRLGGSALAQTFSQVGNECPDVEDPGMLKQAFQAIQSLIEEEVITAGHDVSDGGLIVTLLEMAFSGNAGFDIELPAGVDDPLAYLFAEELGLVIEVPSDFRNYVLKFLSDFAVPCYELGKTTKDKTCIVRNINGNKLLAEPMINLRQIWENTSYELEKLQCNPECAQAESLNIYDRPGPEYHLSFFLKATPANLRSPFNRPKVAVIREEGSNGDR